MLKPSEIAQIVLTYKAIPDKLRNELLRTCVLAELTKRCSDKCIDVNKPIDLRMEARLLADQISNWLIEFTEE